MALSNVNADFNGFGIGSDQRGIMISTDGKITITCSEAYKNKNQGLYVEGRALPGPTALKLQGFYSYENGEPDYFNTTTSMVETSCP